jgi:DNA-binding NarL/FixJ family response regulator
MSVPDKLKQGRESYRQRAWGDAYQSFSLADQATPLEGEDLELLAVSAYLIGRDDDFLRVLERAHHAYVDAGNGARAVRCAFWLGLGLMLRGETARATGWLARAQRLLEREGRDCVERGYLLLPAAEQHFHTGHYESAYTTATDAAGIGERFKDADLIACARHLQGRALVQQAQVEKGLVLLDEAMVSVTAGELSPVMTGLIYCSVIDTCQQVCALERAHEWTTALARWCEEQHELVAFTGTCLVHRAEILQLQGAWRDAIEEARRACDRFSRGIEQRPPAAAFYQQAEVHRLRGEFAAAEECYRNVSQWGGEPQPGLALLRLAQGRTDAAAAAMRRVMSATTDPLQRTKLLPAYIEIMLAVGETQEARDACRELDEAARSFGTDVLSAMAAQARGAVELAEGDAETALGSLRRASQAWQKIEAPYAAARVRVLVALGCRALGDEDGAALELAAARAIFDRLGAAPELTRIDSLTQREPSNAAHGLTARERQVLRLIAGGKTNRAIAAELSISEKTVARHVSNIFGKLGLSTRAAATAYAYQHSLA